MHNGEGPGCEDLIRLTAAEIAEPLLDATSRSEQARGRRTRDERGCLSGTSLIAQIVFCSFKFPPYRRLTQNIAATVNNSCSGNNLQIDVQYRYMASGSIWTKRRDQRKQSIETMFRKNNPAKRITTGEGVPIMGRIRHSSTGDGQCHH